MISFKEFCSINEVDINLKSKVIKDKKQMVELIKKFTSPFENVKYKGETSLYKAGKGVYEYSIEYYFQIDFFKSILKLKSKILSNQYVFVKGKYYSDIGGHDFIEPSINVTLQIGKNPGAVTFTESSNDVYTVSGIKMLFDKCVKRASVDKTAKIKALAAILNRLEPIDSKSAIKLLDIGIGSYASTTSKHSYDNVYNIMDLMKNFSPEEFKQAVKNDFSLSKDKISFNFDKGLMYKNGTWTDTYD